MIGAQVLALKNYYIPKPLEFPCLPLAQNSLTLHHHSLLEFNCSTSTIKCKLKQKSIFKLYRDCVLNTHTHTHSHTHTHTLTHTHSHKHTHTHSHTHSHTYTYILTHTHTNTHTHTHTLTLSHTHTHTHTHTLWKEETAPWVERGLLVLFCFYVFWVFWGFFFHF